MIRKANETKMPHMESSTPRLSSMYNFPTSHEHRRARIELPRRTACKQGDRHIESKERWNFVRENKPRDLLCRKWRRLNRNQLIQYKTRSRFHKNVKLMFQNQYSATGKGSYGNESGTTTTTNYGLVCNGNPPLPT
jgi:hypothetical protein